MASDFGVPTGRVVVVGGANTDIVGRSFEPLIGHDSNPGYVRLSSGGVGRNIAENLARLGVEVELVTALGGDNNAAQLADGCRQAGVGLEAAYVARELPGSLYLAILDEGGDMALALNDMRALERLTPAVLAERSATFAGADLVVLDANPHPDSLAWIARAVSAPLLLDPVSAAKAPRALEILDRLAALKCNALEAAALLGSEVPSSHLRIEHASQRLMDLGVGAVYLTAGPDGVHYRDEDESGWLPAPGVEVANATGAGDAFSAGVAAGMLEGFSARRCALLGSALAGLTLASEQTVSDRITWETVRAASEETEL